MGEIERGSKTFRWWAVVWYFTKRGDLEVEHFFVEIEELHDLIENGPGFMCIKKIEVYYLGAKPAMMTIEESLLL